MIWTIGIILYEIKKIIKKKKNRKDEFDFIKKNEDINNKILFYISYYLFL